MVVMNVSLATLPVPPVIVSPDKGSLEYNASVRHNTVRQCRI